MQDKIQHRLQALKSEFEAGQKMLTDLETQQSTLRTTLLRISGAIQVLEELIVSDVGEVDNNAHNSSPQLIATPQES